MKSRKTLTALGLLALAFAAGYLARRLQSAEHGAEAAAEAVPLSDSDRRKSIKAPAEGLKTLLALPYVDAMPDPEPDQSGVLLHNEERAWPGLNFYHSRTGREA